MARPRRFDIAAIDDVAHGQGGVVSFHQLVELGVSNATISRWTRTGGPLQRVLPGTYLVHKGTPTLHERLHAGLRYAGRTSRVTGSVALHLHGLRYAPGPAGEVPLHLLVPTDRHVKSSGFVIIERTTRLPEPVELSGYPVAPLARSLFDAGRRSASRRAIRAFVLEAIQRRLVSIEEIQDELRHGQRRWTALLRDVLTDAASGVRSAQEASLRDVILNSDLPEPLWNPRLETANGVFIAEPDGYYDDIGMAIELDSREHHFTDLDMFEKTWSRHSVYNRHRIIAERIVPSDLGKDPDGVIRAISATRASYAGREAPQVVVIPNDVNKRAS
jgi:hypothetical protein